LPQKTINEGFRGALKRKFAHTDI